MQCNEKDSTLLGIGCSPKKGYCGGKRGDLSHFLLGAGVLGDSLGALRHGVLGQLTRQQQTNSSLDLATGDGGTLVVVGQTGGFSGDSLEDIVDKAVHDGHSLAADASVGVHLLQHLVDVDSVAFLPLPLALLVAGANSLGLAGLLGTFG